MLFIQKLTDIRLYIKKSKIGHWLFKGCTAEFIIDAKNTWDPHPVTISNVSAVGNLYEVMADSARGPLVALHQNTVACQFSLNPTYKETTQILKNFVEQKIQEISLQGKLGQRL